MKSATIEGSNRTGNTTINSIDLKPGIEGPYLLARWSLQIARILLGAVDIHGGKATLLFYILSYSSYTYSKL
jgi:hypothetical protein